MSFYNSGISVNTDSGYNLLSSTIIRPPLSITNFSNASSGYNIVVPAVENTSIYKLSAIDSASTTLFIGPNTSVIKIGNMSSSTYLYGKTEIDSSIINIGLRTTINLGNISSQTANISVANSYKTNISVANIDVANISIANLTLVNTSVSNTNVANSIISNTSVANISVANISYLTCNNLSAISTKSCYALWYSNIVNEKMTYIGNASLTIIQKSAVSPLQQPNPILYPNEYTGLFTCEYDGMYACSVIVTPVTVTVKNAIFLSKNNNCIGPLAYSEIANTGNITSISGSITLYCNAKDTLAFYNYGGNILPGNNVSTIAQIEDSILTTATGTQLCSIALL